MYARIHSKSMKMNERPNEVTKEKKIDLVDDVVKVFPKQASAINFLIY